MTNSWMTEKWQNSQKVDGGGSIDRKDDRKSRQLGSRTGKVRREKRRRGKG